MANQHVCFNCGKPFDRASRLASHVYKNHPNAPIPIPNKEAHLTCPTCRKKFPSSYNMCRHFNSAHSGIKFVPLPSVDMRADLARLPDLVDENVCPVCRRRFATPRGMRIHLQRIHPEANESGDNAELVESERAEDDEDMFVEELAEDVSDSIISNADKYHPIIISKFEICNFVIFLFHCKIRSSNEDIEFAGASEMEVSVVSLVEDDDMVEPQLECPTETMSVPDVSIIAHYGYGFYNFSFSMQGQFIFNNVCCDELDDHRLVGRIEELWPASNRRSWSRITHLPFQIIELDFG